MYKQPPKRHRLAGTENVPGIVGLGKACERARIGLERRQARIRSLRDALETGLGDNVPNVRVNGYPGQRLPNTLNMTFEGVFSELLLPELNRNGIAVSAGSACSSESREVSRILSAMGLSSTAARSTLRFSLGSQNTREDIDYVLGVLPPLMERIRAGM